MTFPAVAMWRAWRMALHTARTRCAGAGNRASRPIQRGSTVLRRPGDQARPLKGSEADLTPFGLVLTPAELSPVYRSAKDEFSMWCCTPPPGRCRMRVRGRPPCGVHRPPPCHAPARTTPPPGWIQGDVVDLVDARHAAAHDDNPGLMRFFPATETSLASDVGPGHGRPPNAPVRS